MKGTVIFSIMLSYFLYPNVYLESVLKDTSESFIVHYLEDKQIVPVSIELNAYQQTEHVSSIGGETLYDFNQGNVAYKDLNSSQCFIADIVGESLERDRRKLQHLRKGIVRGFFMPTFSIQEEFGNETDLLGKFGIRIAEFCKGCIVSFVRRQQRTNRGKRDTPEEKGQFTHHSYGHYGHQSNNYAHYGHETHITGNVDKDGNIRNHRVSQYQVRSEDSKSFPDQRSNVPQTFATDSKTGLNPQFQTQPASSQTWVSGRRPYGTDASGQFSLQTAQESGYQLNLPLGLRAGNAYRGGIRSSGQYSVGGSQPQITTDYQKYPAPSSGMYQPSTDQNGLRQISPHIPSIPTGSHIPSDVKQTGISIADHTKITDREAGSAIGYPGYPDQTRTTHGLPRVHETKMQGSHIQQGISIPVQTGGLGHRLQTSGGLLDQHTRDSQTDSRTFTASDGRQPATGYEPLHRGFADRTIAPSRQVISARDDQQRTSLHKPLDRGIYPDERRITQRLDQPAIQTTALRLPTDQEITTGRQVIPSRSYQPGVFYPGSDVLVPGYQTSLPGMQHPSEISKPGYHIPRPSLDSRYQQYAPGGPISPQYLQTPADRYPITTNGMAPGSQNLQTFPGSVISDRRDGSSYPGQVSTIPGIINYTSPGTISRYGETPGFYPQHPSIGSDHLGVATPDGRISRQGVPISTSRDRTLTGMRPDDARLLQPRGTDTVSPEVRGQQVPHTFGTGGIDRGSSLYPSRVLSTRASPESTVSRDRTLLTSQTRPGISGLHGQESASSQTQIQTNNDATAAEASAAGQYRGLGSQTQVQGGYAGNGSFSAQAQSGFTGGVVQSQVQGNSQGGLSGSSAQVEQLGEAQSQVQVGQPSGAASSSAQGRFTGGITQVQAQSGKTGGSAGAQSQSSGLSSSQVQVNIGGKDVSEQDHFQGSVSASVHGGYSSGQSQTQLQGGYQSGRNYVATAQGGFDSAVGFQGLVPPLGSLHSLSGQSSQLGQTPGYTSSPRTQSGTSGTHLAIPGTPGMLIGPSGSGIIDKTADIFRPDNQTSSISGRLQPPTYEQPSTTFVDRTQPQPSNGYPSHLATTRKVPQPGSIPSSYHTQTEGAMPGISYPSESYHIPRSIDSIAQYPSSPGSQQPGYLTPSYTARHPYSIHPQANLSGLPMTTVDRKLTPSVQALPSYTNGQTTLYASGVRPESYFPGVPPEAASVSGQRINGFGIGQPPAFSPDAISPDYRPGLHVSPSYFPDLRQPGSPGISHVPQQPEQHSARVPTGHYLHQPFDSRQRPDSEDLSHLRSQYTPGYTLSHVPSLPMDPMPRLTRPDYVQQPGFQQGFYYPPPLMPGQPQISPPRPEIVPSQQRPAELPTLTRPDGSPYISSQPRTPQQQGFYYPSQPIPGQPQVSQSRQDALPPQKKPGESPIVTTPDYSHFTDSPPGTPQQPGQAQILTPIQQVPQPPSISPTSRIYPSLPTTDRTQTELPGVQEPDTQNCCEALRNLKRRCCGKQNGNAKSSCCKSKTTDFDFDFSSEDDLDDSNGNGDCKVVKAICYIVYKPVGKARVCKPTQTNGC